jgi:cytochrome c-type protein NapC
MFLVGIIFWGGFNTAMEMTNTEQFCAETCHEMKAFIVPEWKDSPHYANASGVRAICSDCHVPHPWIYKMKRKIEASKEVWYHLTGKISTREKFEAHRGEMAERVWAAMEASDSRECRNCHHSDYFAYSKESEKAARGHRRGLAEGKTCIDCHKGIAHKLPEEIAAEQSTGDNNP